ncbi:MAG: L-threonylcarbamoyladenylate synthase [Gammaproteobacteria bacterium]|nr:L-threonylcarbamoyladenylate synthase [Gammaproteobacteria bacterium]MDH5629289.1 L-threonylcarbamoyladenylate synthase [Gammaproteobacteria bacterium]
MIEQSQIEKAILTLAQGGVIAYPTESVYGLGCDPANQQALSKILQIKNRQPDKGLIILVSDILQAENYIQPLSDSQLEKITQTFERATTWLLPAKLGISEILTGGSDRIAVRITQHPVARSLCELSQSALVSTSCNLSGEKELINANQVRNSMGDVLDMIVDADVGGQPPSRIIDLQSGKILRE